MSKKDKARTMTLGVDAIPDVLHVLHLGIENLGKSESMTFEQGKAALASYREACSVKLGNLTKVFPNVLAVNIGPGEVYHKLTVDGESIVLRGMEELAVLHNTLGLVQVAARIDTPPLSGGELDFNEFSVTWDRDGVDITMPSMAFIDKVEEDAGRMD